jgi:pilus assembly protein CpaE
MMRGLIISPDRELASQLDRVLADSGSVSVIRSVDRYPGSVELTRFVRAHAPHVVFVSMESVSQAGGIQAALQEALSGIQIIAIHRTTEPQLLLDVMRLGIREFLAYPFDRKSVVDAVNRAGELLSKNPLSVDATDLVYSFLPSKAGVGTSTIALNAAVAASQLKGTKVFLSDFDLNSGMIRFMLKLQNHHSVIDAAERSVDIDENFWPQLVTGIGSLDVLHAGTLNPNFRMEAAQVRNLLDFARRNYKVICADLSGNLEKYSIELMHESKKIFLVCTPEIPSLHLAREKFHYLRTLDLGDRVSVLLNRCQKRPLISPSQVEELLGLPVHMTFSNDYQGVNKAMSEGKPVDSGSELGRQCAALAGSMLERKMTDGPESKRRFVEYFSLVPTRLTLENK